MRNCTRLRAILLILPLMCCLLLLPLKVAGSSTTLTVHVPETHTIDLQIRGRGSVHLGDIVYTGSATIEMPRLSALQILITPEKNGSVHSVRLNGTAQEIIDGCCTLEIPALTENITLEVLFRTFSIIPDTGDSIHIPVMIMVLSTIASLLIFRRKQK